jgi:hypothetical protein
MFARAGFEKERQSMVAVTYGVRVPATKVAPRKAAPKAPAAPSKTWYARFFDALIESRMQKARREVARHIHLLPYSLDERGNRLVKTSAKDMPFGGW